MEFNITRLVGHKVVQCPSCRCFAELSDCVNICGLTQPFCKTCGMKIVESCMHCPYYDQLVPDESEEGCCMFLPFSSQVMPDQCYLRYKVQDLFCVEKKIYVWKD